MTRWQADGMEPEAAAARVAAAPYGPDPRRKQGEVLTPEAIAARAYALLHADPGRARRGARRHDARGDRHRGAGDRPGARSSPPARRWAPRSRPATRERLARTHPDVTVMRLDGAGHSIHDERAHRDDYTARLADFLAVVEQRQ